MFDSDVGSFGLWVRVSRKASLVSARRSQTLSKKATCSPSQEQGSAKAVATWRGWGGGSWLRIRTRGAEEGSLPHHHAWERDILSRGPQGGSTDVSAHNKDEGAQATCAKRGKPSAPQQQEDQLVRGHEGTSKPLLSDLRVFFPWAALTISLAAHPALQLMLPGVKSGAGSEDGFAVFFSGRNGLYLKPCPTFTCFPAQTHPSLSFCLNKFHCPA